MLCDLFQLLVDSYGLWVDGGYASVVLTSPRYVMCVSQRGAFFVGVCVGLIMVLFEVVDVCCVGQ